MISRETVEQFAKEQNDYLVREGVRSTEWERSMHRSAYVRSVREAFRSIGVKVEGDEQ